MRYTIQIFIFCATAAALLLSCTKDSVSLDGTSWKLYSITKSGQTSIVEDSTTVTLTFKTDQISGQGGCNGYGGNYSTDGSDISISGVVSTQIACEFLEIENRYFELIPQSETWAINNTELTLNGAGTNQLVFKQE